MPECPAKNPDPSRQVATAYHEAGHAVMALSLGRPIKKVTIKPSNSQLGDRRLGACEIKKGRTKATKDELEDEVLILFAGMVSEARFTGQYCEKGAAQDLRMIQRLLAARAGGEKQLQRLQQRLLDKTENALDDPGHVAAIELIVEELLEKETVSGRAVRHFYNQAIQQNS